MTYKEKLKIANRRLRLSRKKVNNLHIQVYRLHKIIDDWEALANEWKHRYQCASNIQYEFCPMTKRHLFRVGETIYEATEVSK